MIIIKMKPLLLTIALLFSTPANAFERLINIIGDGSDISKVVYVSKRCGILFYSMSENFALRNKPEEKEIVENLSNLAVLMLHVGRKIELENYPNVSEENHKKQLELIAQVYVNEMETYFAQTGDKISDNISSDLKTCNQISESLKSD